MTEKNATPAEIRRLVTQYGVGGATISVVLMVAIYLEASPFVLLNLAALLGINSACTWYLARGIG